MSPLIGDPGIELFDWLPPAHQASVPLQVYGCQPLALAFMELTVMQRFHEHIHSSSVPPSLRTVLGRLSTLYGLWCLSQRMALLYRGEAAPWTAV